MLSFFESSSSITDTVLTGFLFHFDFYFLFTYGPGLWLILLAASTPL
jgi:hypothetical protein